MTEQAAPRRVAFFGSPDFAVPVLDAVAAAHQVVLVVAQNDKPVGRGLKLTSPPVAEHARALGLALAQPRRLKGNAEFSALLRASGAEVAVTCAYGKLLPPSLLEALRYGFLNTHTSLLPQLRGAAPIQWALIEGLTRSGTTIMQTDAGMDTGDIVLQEALEIAPHWTSVDLASALQVQACGLIVTALNHLAALERRPQNHAAATYAAMLSKADGDLQWQHSAQQNYNRYRGVYAWPQSSAFVRGKRLKVLALLPTDGEGRPGQILSADESGVKVACAAGALLLQTVQPEGKKPMPAHAWWRGSALSVGDTFDLSP